MLATLAGQERISDNEAFNAWLRGYSRWKQRISSVLRRPLPPEHRPAFTAGLGTEPFKSEQALPGPIFMPQYHNAKQERSAALSQQAMTFKGGTDSGDTGTSMCGLRF